MLLVIFSLVWVFLLIDWCVVVVGWVIRFLVFFRLLEIWISFRVFINLKVVFLLFVIFRVIMVELVCICCLVMLVCGWLFWLG